MDKQILIIIGSVIFILVLIGFIGISNQVRQEDEIQDQSRENKPTDSDINRPFIISVDTTLNGSTDDNQFQIKTQSNEGEEYEYDYQVDWGDGETDQGVTGNITHTYDSSGTYDIAITGQFPALYYRFGAGDVEKIITIKQWGDIKWRSMENAFSGAKHMQGTFTDTPDLSQVTNMSNMFAEAENFNQDIGDWDVSSINYMGSMFARADSFNQDIGDWDVSNVWIMDAMFKEAKSFNQYIGDWDVSNVATMNAMFMDAESFNQDIGEWDVGNVTNMGSMFFRASSFNQDIEDWDVSNVDSIMWMFLGAESFNQDLSSWCGQKIEKAPNAFDLSEPQPWDGTEKHNWGAPCSE